MVRIAIDAGHGSGTAGKRTPDGWREHWSNVKMALFFEEACIRNGFEIYRTGYNDANAKDDADISLSTRQKKIKKADCDISVSFHCNAYGDGRSFNQAEGFEVLLRTESSRKLANLILEEMAKGSLQKNRGVKVAGLAMCNTALLGVKAAVLIEAGFMTNRREAELIRQDAFCKETAEKVCRGVCRFFGISYKEAGKETVSLVRITANILNVRSGPGLAFPVTVSVRKGEVYTIIEENNGWGRLKSGAGWISMNYVQKL